MELTKEYFEEHLAKQFSQKLTGVVTKEYFKEHLEKQFNQKLKGLVTKEYFEEYFDEHLEEKLSPIRSDISDLKVKVNSIAIDVTDIRAKVDRIDKRDLEDSDAFARIATKHNHRISRIERKLKIPTPKIA